MRVFLTGVTGYVGGHVAEELVSRGHELAVLVRGEADDQAARRLGAWPLRGSLGDPAWLRGIASEVDAIAHCAASEREGFAEQNLAAVEAMLAGLRPGCGFAMHGGTLVFGDTGERVFDGRERFAPPPMLAARARLDARVLAAGEERGLRCSIAYAAFVYGGGSGGVLPTTLLRAAMTAGFSGRPAGCEPLWSTVHVADWAALIAEALGEAPVGGHGFVAAGRCWPISEVADLVARSLALGPPQPVARADAEGLWGPLGPALFLNQAFDARHAEERLDWAPVEEDLEAEIEALALVLRGASAGGGRA